MNHHVHTAGLAIIITIATMGAWHYLIRTVAAHHADNPALAGAAYIW